MLQQAILNTLETNKKLFGKQKISTKKTHTRYKEEPNGNFRAEKYIYKNKKLGDELNNRMEGT